MLPYLMSFPVSYLWYDCLNKFQDKNLILKPKIQPFIIKFDKYKKFKTYLVNHLSAKILKVRIKKINQIGKDFKLNLLWN